MLTPAYSVAWKSTIRRGQSMPADWPCLVYALFMPCLYLLYALFMPSMWVWCDMRSSHVMPTLACAMAGIYGCGIHDPVHLNMKTRHCISGWGRSIPWGLWFDPLSSSAFRRRRWVVRDEWLHGTRLRLQRGAEHLSGVWDGDAKRCLRMGGTQISISNVLIHVNNLLMRCWLFSIPLP